MISIVKKAYSVLLAQRTRKKSIYKDGDGRIWQIITINCFCYLEHFEESTGKYSNIGKTSSQAQFSRQYQQWNHFGSNRNGAAGSICLESEKNTPSIHKPPSATEVLKNKILLIIYLLWLRDSSQYAEQMAVWETATFPLTASSNHFELT